MTPHEEFIKANDKIISSVITTWGFSKQDIFFNERKIQTIKWFDNFKPSELNNAFEIFKKVQYKTIYDINDKIKLASKELSKLFSDDFSNVLFYPLGLSSSSSGSMYLYNYSHILKLDNKNYKYDSFKYHLNKYVNIVFIDDIIGSGNQAIRFFNNHLINSTAKCFYISLYGFERGIEKINKEARFEMVFTCKTLSDEEMAFSENSYIFKDPIKKAELKAFCENHGKKLYPEYPLGYDDSQALLVFPHNTPNNTLPIIWASSENEKEIGVPWNPLCERIKKVISKKSIKIEYPGAIQINSFFLTAISDNNFTPYDFYTSKLKEHCQWFGILKHWDIKRFHLDNIKNQIIQSFSYSRDAKVTAVVYGPGGCGKSTLLRRIAVDLVNEDIIILWLTDIDTFYDLSLDRMQDSTLKYLIFIEDWYRFSDNSNNLHSLLTGLLSITNARIVIGDRTIKDNFYIRHLYKPNDNKYFLSADENSVLINEIMDNIPTWRTAFEKVALSSDYKSITLYLLLFIIARTAKQSNTKETVDIDDLMGHYRAIIESDFNQLYILNKGIAEALLYWAHIYKKYKLFLAVEDFLYLADYFNKDKDISSYFDFNRNDNLNQLLNSYVTINKTTFLYYSNFNQLTFNHDALAEEGLSCIESKTININDAITDFKVLDFAMENFNDYSISRLLYMLLNEKSFFKNDFQKLNYITKLKNRNCSYHLYLQYLFNKDFFPESHKKYAIEFLDRNKKEGLSLELLCNCLEILKTTEEGKQYAIEFLNNNKSIRVANEIICNCLGILKTTEEGKQFAINLLEKNKSVIGSFSIICNCLEIVKTSEAGKQYAINLLEKNKTENLPHQIICKCFEIVKSSKVGKQYAINLLEKNKTENLPYQTICNCLEILKATEKGKQYAVDFLEIARTEYISHQIICVCFEILKNTEKGKQHAYMFLEKNKIDTVPFVIINHCLEILGATAEGKQYAIQFLNNSKTNIVQFQIVCNCLDILKDSEEGKQYAIQFLNKRKTNKVQFQII